MPLGGSSWPGVKGISPSRHRGAPPRLGFQSATPYLIPTCETPEVFCGVLGAVTCGAGPLCRRGCRNSSAWRAPNGNNFSLVTFPSCRWTVGGNRERVNLPHWPDCGYPLHSIVPRPPLNVALGKGQQTWQSRSVLKLRRSELPPLSCNGPQFSPAHLWPLLSHWC